MFRKLAERISSVAASALGSETTASSSSEEGHVRTLTSMGFTSDRARSALQACDGNVDRAAEWLLAQEISQRRDVEMEDNETLQRVMEESRRMEEVRLMQMPRTANSSAGLPSSGNVNRTEAMNKAAEAAALRAAKTPSSMKKNPPRLTTAAGRKAAEAADIRSKNSSLPAAPAPQLKSADNLLSHHPDVKLVPKLQDKSKEEQVLRCADRLKGSPQAVDTLLRALTALQNDPNNLKYRKVDKTTSGYQRSLAPAPGAEDMFLAMNFRRQGPNDLVLDMAMVDPALLYLGVSALEQTRLTKEYKELKLKESFAKELQQILSSADSSEAEAILRAEFMAKCPTEPSEGRGALMQVAMADETVRRRFDGDDTLADVLNWLGGHGSAIPKKIMEGDWCLVDVNRYPMAPMDCSLHQHHTLQYIGCWPSGRLEVFPTREEWRSGEIIKPGSSRGLGSAPSDAL